MGKTVETQFLTAVLNVFRGQRELKRLSCIANPLQHQHMLQHNADVTASKPHHQSP